MNVYCWFFEKFTNGSPSKVRPSKVPVRLIKVGNVYCWERYYIDGQTFLCSLYNKKPIILQEQYTAFFDRFEFRKEHLENAVYAKD